MGSCVLANFALKIVKIAARTAAMSAKVRPSA